MVGYRQTRTIIKETKEERLERMADDAALSESMPDMTVVFRKPECEPEYESVEAFIEFCMDDERDTFTTEELVKLSDSLKLYNRNVRKMLEGYGLKLATRGKEREIRGVTANPYTLYQGNPMSGGTGFENNGVGHVYRSR